MLLLLLLMLLLLLLLLLLLTTTKQTLATTNILFFQIRLEVADYGFGVTVMGTANISCAETLQVSAGPVACEHNHK